MFYHMMLGADTEERRRHLFRLIHSGRVTLGGYRKAGIYGLLTCSAGKRMKPENRVFFADETEALARGYRPCGRCLPEKYKHWKHGVTGASKRE